MIYNSRFSVLVDGQTIIIIRERQALRFNGLSRAKNPINVWLAIMKVARYLKWIPYNANFPAATISKSQDGLTFFVDDKEVMHLCQSGNTDHVYITRNQLIGVKEAFHLAPHENLLLPANALEEVSQLMVTKLPPSISFDKNDYDMADKSFRNFLEINCQTPDTYNFKLEEFQEKTHLPNSDWVWNYFKRFKKNTFNGMYITNPHIQDGHLSFTLS